MRVWSADEVLALPAVTDLVTAGEILGVGRTAAHEMARAGTFPVPVLRLGARYRVPSAALLRLLELVPERSDAGPCSGPAYAIDETADATPAVVHLDRSRRGTSPR